GHSSPCTDGRPRTSAGIGAKKESPGRSRGSGKRVSGSILGNRLDEVRVEGDLVHGERVSAEPASADLLDPKGDRCPRIDEVQRRRREVELTPPGAGPTEV